METDNTQTIDTFDRVKPVALTGALVGLLLTLPLMAEFFLGEVIFNLPLVPLDVFLWFSRIEFLGPLITLGIDTMVSTLIVLGLSVRDTAKPAEFIMALGMFAVLGAVVGTAYFEYMRRNDASTGATAGIIAGAIFGVPVLLISMSIPSTAPSPFFINVLWTLLLFIVWGAVLGWVHERLIDLPATDAAADEMILEQVSRRQFLVKLGGATAALTVVGAGLAFALDDGSGDIATAETGSGQGDNDPSPTPQPPVERDADMVAAPGTRPEYTPLEDHYRIDIALAPPNIDGARWTLPVTGLVANPMDLTIEDIRAYPSVDEIITLSCISNRVGGELIGTTRWTGFSIQHLLEDVQPSEDAVAVKVSSSDGFHETIDLDLIREDERVMFAYEWDGKPLTIEHGYPLRTWVPNRYGMKQPKWITKVEFIGDHDQGYWVRRGWDKDALVRTTGVIDAVAVQDTYEENGQNFVPIGGIAYAGAKGISRVEVRVDDGEWEEATLMEPLSDYTWVVWRYDWGFTPGDYLFRVRAYNGNGELQITADSGPRPSGATGIDQHRQTL